MRQGLSKIFHLLALGLKAIGMLVVIQNFPCAIYSLFADERFEHCSGNFLFDLLVVFGGIIVAYAGYRIEYRIRQKAQQKRDAQVGNSPLEDYILYLRPFFSDGKVLVSHPKQDPVNKLTQLAYFTKIDFQELLVLISKRNIVALGKMGVNFGPGSIETPDQDWFIVFKDLASKASLIILMPAYSEGTLQEMLWLRQNGYFNKCLFIMPPAFFKPERKSTFHFWEKTRRKLKRQGILLPIYRKEGSLFSLRAGRPKIQLRRLIKRWEVFASDEGILDIKGLQKAMSISKKNGRILIPGLRVHGRQKMLPRRHFAVSQTSASKKDFSPRNIT